MELYLHYPHVPLRREQRQFYVLYYYMHCYCHTIKISTTFSNMEIMYSEVPQLESRLEDRLSCRFCFLSQFL